MEMQWIEQSIGVSESLFEGTLEQPVDGDITLPDYCADVQRILKCMICPRISSVQTTGERISAEGSALVRLLYVSDGGRICSHEQSYPFSRYVECKRADGGSCASVQPMVSYVNCRAISPRRVDVHGMLNLQFRVVKQREEHFLCGAQLENTGSGQQIQLKKHLRQIASVMGETERAFSLSEVAELPQEKPPLSQTVWVSALALAEEVKAVQNKLLVKGELLVTLLYLAESPENEPQRFAHSLPISQIIEMEGVDETADTAVILTVAALDVLPKADGAGEQRLLDITARVAARVTADCAVDLPVLADAYVTRGALKLERKTAEFRRPVERFRDSFAAKGGAELSAVSRVLEVWCGDIQSSAAAAQELLSVSGTAAMHILYLDGENEPQYAERPLDFSYQRSLREKIERLQCEPSVRALACGWTQGTGGTVDLQLELKIEAAAYALETDRIVSGMELQEDGDGVPEGAALYLYYARAGESLWDIARSHNTTVEAVQAENGIQGECVAEKRLLMLPGM